MPAELTAPWWTPWPGPGPGHDLLGDPTGLTVLEIGCGTGTNAAALATAGAHVTGIDHNPAKIQQARTRWAGTPRLRFHHADATSYLATHPGPVDVVCSIFGALSFTPAEPLLQHIHDALHPHGRLAIAARTPPPTKPGDDDPEPWHRHARSLPSWTRLLTRHNLTPTTTTLIDHPIGSTEAACLLVVAHRSGDRRT